MLTQTTFGYGSAEFYLADLLNDLKDKKVSAECMKIIADARYRVDHFRKIKQQNIVPLCFIIDMVRLARTEQRIIDKARLKRYSSLSDDKSLPIKVAINICSASWKQLAVEFNEEWMMNKNVCKYLQQMKDKKDAEDATF